MNPAADLVRCVTRQYERLHAVAKPGEEVNLYVGCQFGLLLVARMVAETNELLAIVVYSGDDGAIIHAFHNAVTFMCKIEPIAEEQTRPRIILGFGQDADQEGGFTAN
jgi:hypothetical protein